MANAPLAARNALRHDLSAVQKEVSAGVVANTAKSDARNWGTWVRFCHELNADPFLARMADPVPILQVFARRVRRGELAHGGAAVRSRTAEAYLRSVGQTYARLGIVDPRIDTFGNIDFRIKRQLSCYTKEDPPATRVKPIPVQILHQTFLSRQTLNTTKALVTGYAIYMAFFFLMRPGEYCRTTTEENAPFRLCDVQLWAGQCQLNVMTDTPARLRTATFVGLTFTTQKNGITGEVIGHGRSGALYACPVSSVVELVCLLRAWGAPPTTPLASFRAAPGRPLTPLVSADITNALRAQVRNTGATVGLADADISARSLRASGAMALLIARVDSDRIRLVGRWRSDEMFRYLHVQARPLMSGFATAMLSGGDYSLIPSQP